MTKPPFEERTPEHFFGQLPKIGAVNSASTVEMWLEMLKTAQAMPAVTK